MKKMFLFVMSFLLIGAHGATCAGETWRYEETLGRILTISAEVYSPDVVELPSLICEPIHYRDFDTEELLEKFGSNASQEYSLLRANDGSLHFENQSGHRAWSALTYSTAEIPMDHALESLSIDSLQEDIRSLLDYLGVDQIDFSEIEGMRKSDYNTLYESGRAAHEEDLAIGLTKLGATEWFDWPKDDVCYICTLRQTYHEVAIYPRIVQQQLFGKAGISYEYGPSIELYRFEEGVGRITIANAYSFDPQDDYTRVYSFDEALQSFKQKGTAVLSLNPQVIQNIGLYYLVQYEEGVFIARPYWIFEVVQTDPNSGVKITSREALDARSGEWK